MDVLCKSCGEEIDLRTDDYYNIDHTKVGCPYCGDVRSALEYERNSDSDNGDVTPNAQ